MRKITRPVASGKIRILYDIVREKTTESNVVQCAQDAVKVFRGFQRDSRIPAEREAFAALYLDSQHRLIGFHVVSIGSLASSIVHPREVFRPAVGLGAKALVVAHNHPSGDPTPSIEDRQVTERLREAGECLGIELLDHLVLGNGRFYSFAEGVQFIDGE